MTSQLLKDRGIIDRVMDNERSQFEFEVRRARRSENSKAGIGTRPPGPCPWRSAGPIPDSAPADSNFPSRRPEGFCVPTGKGVPRPITSGGNL